MAQKEGWIYLLHALGTDRYKIGHTKSLPNRIKDLAQQSPYPVELIDSFYSPDRFRDERYLHRDLAEYRVYGEWFQMCFDRVANRECWFFSYVELEEYPGQADRWKPAKVKFPHFIPLSPEERQKLSMRKNSSDHKGGES